MSVLSKIDNRSFILVLISIFAIVAISKMYNAKTVKTHTQQKKHKKTQNK